MSVYSSGRYCVVWVVGFVLTVNLVCFLFAVVFCYSSLCVLFFFCVGDSMHLCSFFFLFVCSRPCVCVCVYLCVCVCSDLCVCVCSDLCVLVCVFWCVCVCCEVCVCVFWCVCSGVRSAERASELQSV